MAKAPKLFKWQAKGETVELRHAVTGKEVISIHFSPWYGRKKCYLLYSLSHYHELPAGPIAEFTTRDEAKAFALWLAPAAIEYQKIKHAAGEAHDAARIAAVKAERDANVARAIETEKLAAFMAPRGVKVDIAVDGRAIVDAAEMIRLINYLYKREALPEGIEAIQ